MKVIGVGGFARAGKDTFVKIAINILEKNGYKPLRIAFADVLKEEASEMLKANGFKLDVYTIDPKEKEKIRPLLVWWGCARRDFWPEYWIDLADSQVDEHGRQGLMDGNYDKFIALISDVRFPNESKWIHEAWDGWFIHIRRYQMLPDQYATDRRVFDLAPNAEEAKQDPLIQEMADDMVEWGSKNIMTPDEAVNDSELRQIVFGALLRCPYFINARLSL